MLKEFLSSPNFQSDLFAYTNAGALNHNGEITATFVSVQKSSNDCSQQSRVSVNSILFARTKFR